MDKSVKCVICDGDAFVTGVTKTGACYLRCVDCSSLQRKETVSDDELVRWYGSDYRPVGGRHFKLLRIVRTLVWRNIARTVDAISPPGVIIDVGAGEGELAKALRLRGRECIAIDPYSCSDSVRPQRLSELRTNGKAACLVYWHSFEHIVDPHREAEAISDSLQRGGVLILALPNPCSIQARLFGGRWYGLDLGRHLHIISVQGLTRLFGPKGFEINTRHWRGGDGWQSFSGWLDGLLQLTGWRSGLMGLVLAKRNGRRFSRWLGILFGSCIMPVAGLLTVVEAMLGRRGATQLIASRFR